MLEQISNEIYTSEMYKTTRTNSYTVQVTCNDNSIVYSSIRFFFEVENDLYFMVRCFSIEHTKMFFHVESNMIIKHILPIKEENIFILLKAKDLIAICHIIRVGNYICKCPNTMKKIM